MTTTKTPGPQIYVACLAAYNSGHLHGKWITPKTDKEELEEQFEEVIKTSPVADAEECPAYVRSCEKFFDSICWPSYYGGTNTNGKIYKRQASSTKRQAPSSPAGLNDATIKK